jgi:predicted HAD superfamily phosphohydrolase YqeG
VTLRQPFPSTSSGPTRSDIRSVAVVGDRLLTDVALANLHGMLSVHTLPLTLEGENAAVRLGRWFESKVLDEWLCAGVEPPRHACLDALKEDKIKKNRL